MSQTLIVVDDLEDWAPFYPSDQVMSFKAYLDGGRFDNPQRVRIINLCKGYRYLADGMVWFDFEALCGPPRSQNDYIELARCHQTVFISDIPVMGGSRDDRTRRFVFLVDEFYDRRVKLILSAEVGVSELYAGTRLAFEFERTTSRLVEMQSTDYLALPHLA